MERRQNSNLGGNGEDYDSRTEAQAWSTAAEIGKTYAHQAPVSTNPNKSSDRSDDGPLNSAAYAARRRTAHGPGHAEKGSKPRYVHMDYHHRLEDVLGTWPMRKLLGYVSKRRARGHTLIEEILSSYANPEASLGQRIKYWPFHKFIDRMRGTVTAETFRRRVGEHVSTIRGLVITARSLAEFGLTLPQRFSAPLFTVWNFTNQCNLSCRHCYQDSGRRGLGNELTLEEKLDLVDQMAAEYVPMIAFAGGEPTLSKDLLPVLKRCQGHGIHATIASHGGTITERYAARLAEAGVKYVEISLDSVDPQEHDAFRGHPGMWQRTVSGMRNVVAQEGLRLGVAMCVHRGNVHEVEDMLRFAVDIGASCLAHFNFIPVGRGLTMVENDLDPRQRERLLQTLNQWMQSGKIGVISTAPQFGRVCIAHSPVDGLQSCSHAGSGGGEKARVIAKYLGGCGAGRTYVCLEPDGTITPCVYMPQRVLGNIRRRPFRDIFRNNEFWDVLSDRDRRLHHCEVCEFKHYCGGCRARADAYYGQINAGDPGCIFNQSHWDDLVTGRGAEAAESDFAAPSSSGDPHPALGPCRVETSRTSRHYGH
jgi:radical SAM protein with 4Fe4S-binding SPASM domain